MKQTAVEWFVIELKKLNIEVTLEIEKKAVALFEQAKEMDKEQKIAFAENYETKVHEGMLKSAEQYYKETFKSE
jgi:hypothetical protein